MAADSELFRLVFDNWLWLQEGMLQDNLLSGNIRWISGRELARLLHLHPQTLGNWRYQDRRAGRDHAAPGRPLYKRFGGAVRYAVLPDGTPVLMPPDGEDGPVSSDDSD